MSRPKHYVCGHCGGSGHNKRTCKWKDLPAVEAAVRDREELAEAMRASGAVRSAVEDEGAERDDWKVGDKFTVREPWATEWSDDYRGFVGEVLETSRRHVAALTPRGVRGEFAHQCIEKLVGAGHTYVPEPKPTSKDEKPLTAWELAETVIPYQRLTLLYGPPGTGKTTLANRSALEGQKTVNITLTEETPAAELRGHFVPKGSEFVWMDGPAMLAFRHGHRLVLNEIDSASGDAVRFISALLDDPEVSQFELPTGETVYPSPQFSVVATMNGELDDLLPALLDRFAVRIRVNKIHPDAVKSLPSDLRKPAENGVAGEQTRRTSIRAWKAYAALRESIGEANAAAAVFGDRAETIRNTVKIGALKK